MEEKKANPLSTTLAKLSGSLRGISTAKDFHFYNNFDEFKRPAAQLAAQLAAHSQSMLESIGVSSADFFGKQLAFPEDVDDAYDWLVNVNDEIYESFDHAIDEFKELRRSQFENGIDLVNGKKRTGVMENGDSSLSEVKVAQKDDTSLRAKPKIPFHIPTIPKPQKQYKILVDNSKQPFQHVWLQRSEDGSRFIHPLEKFSPMDFVDKNVTDIKPMKPLPVDFTTYTLVEEVDDLKELAAKLRCADEFAVDLEHNQYRSYQGLTCLMQISTRAEDFVVDTLKLRAHIGTHLREFFMDPTKKKVMHGADRDIMWLQRDFGIYVCNMFDTGQASRVLKLERNSLEYLLQHFCEVAANKEYQNADWRLRPLTDEMLRYAREDTHYLLYIYDLMRIRLLSSSAESESSDASLVEVYQRSYDICMQFYEKDVLTDSSYLHIYGIQSTDLNAQQLAVAAGLCEWRDVVARVEDESTGYILPNKILLEIAKQMPYTTSKLRGVLKSRHHYIDRNLGSVVGIIKNSMKNAAAYEAVAEKLKEERIMMNTQGADGNSVVTDGSEAVSVLDGSNSATETDAAMQLEENITVLKPSSNEVDKNKHKSSSDHSKDNLNIHNEKDGYIPALPRNNFTMPNQIREASETEATVQVLKKPNRGFGALLGNSAAKRKFDHGRKESEEAKLEQIKSSVNLPFHPFLGQVESLQPVVEEPAKPAVNLCHEEPVAVSAANSQVQDVIMIDEESDEELLVDEPKSTDDRLEQFQGNNPAALLPTNSESDDEIFNDDPKSTDDMLEQTEGNEKALPSTNSHSHDIVHLDDDTDDEPVNDDPKCPDDMLQKDEAHTPASSNEKEETTSNPDNRPETTNEMGNTKPVKKLKDQESRDIQIKPFDYEAAIKEFRFGGDRGRKGGDEEPKNRRDGGNRKKSASKSQSDGGEESGGFQLGRRRHAFPATGNRSATFR